jgi:FixJ family two-component response regulator
MPYLPPQVIRQADAVRGLLAFLADPKAVKSMLDEIEAATAEHASTAAKADQVNAQTEALNELAAKFAEGMSMHRDVLTALAAKLDAKCATLVADQEAHKAAVDAHKEAVAAHQARVVQFEARLSEVARLRNALLGSRSNDSK